MSKNLAVLILVLLLVLASPFHCIAQEEKGGEQDRESMALDSTATQWSFQLAYQTMPDYHDDTLYNGRVRPEGADNYWQLRIVAPIPLDTFTILPRLTIRHYENPQGQSGFGNTDSKALEAHLKSDHFKSLLGAIEVLGKLENLHLVEFKVPTGNFR